MGVPRVRPLATTNRRRGRMTERGPERFPRSSAYRARPGAPHDPSPAQQTTGGRPRDAQDRGLINRQIQWAPGPSYAARDVPLAPHTATGTAALPVRPLPRLAQHPGRPRPAPLLQLHAARSAVRLCAHRPARRGLPQPRPVRQPGRLRIGRGAAILPGAGPPTPHGRPRPTPLPHPHGRPGHRA